MKLIIGLGNPGKKYQNTYHNIGHLFVDFLSDKERGFKKDELYLYQSQKEITLVKTTTYMNESGMAVRAALKRFASLAKLSPIIVHDDSDLLIGNYKISERAGAAGHRGVVSVVQNIPSSTYLKRLRIGIRPLRNEAAIEKRPRLKAGDFVLRKIGKADLVTLHLVFEELKNHLQNTSSPRSR